MKSVRLLALLALLVAMTAIGSSASAEQISAGDLDTTFGGGDGKVITDLVTADNDAVRAVAIQADGKIVVAGYSNGSGNDDFALARYTTSGVLDTTFGGGDGKLVTDIVTADQDFAYAVSIQADGKIVVAGTSNGSGTNDFALARYTTAGALDATFGTGGKVTTDIVTADTDIVNAMAIDADGKIVVFGETNGAGAGYDFALVRYTTAGALDATFGTGGKVTTDIGADYGYAVAIQADGKIVVGGTSNGAGTNDFALARYTPAGVLDTTFSQDGKVLTDINTDNDDIRAIAIDADGKIVVAGTSDNGTNIDFTLARYIGAGSGPLDPTETLYALSGDGQISVGWKTPTHVGSGIKTYVASAYPGGSSCTTTGSHVCTITGLTNGTNYAIAITASDTSGKSVVGIGTKPVAPSCEGPAAYGYTLTNTSNGARMEPPPVLLTPNC